MGGDLLRSTDKPQSWLVQLRLERTMLQPHSTGALVNSQPDAAVPFVSERAVSEVGIRKFGVGWLPMYGDIEAAEAGTRAEVERRELTLKRARFIHHSFFPPFILIFKVKIHLLQKF